MDRVRGVSVATPHAVPFVRKGEARAEGVVDGYAGTVGAAEEAPLGMSLGRKIAMAGLALLSVGGAISGALMMEPPAVVRVQERVAPSALIDGMIDRGAGGRVVPAEMRAMVQRQLEGLPVDVLRAIEANGTRIAIMRKGETPMDVGVIRELQIGEAYKDFDGLKGIADAAFARADAKHGARIRGLEGRLEQAREAARARHEADPASVPKPAGLGGILGSLGDATLLEPEVQKVMGDLRRARVERLGEAWDEITTRSGGRLEPFAASLGAFNPMMAGAAGMMPTTLEGLARMHGAVTPSEVEAFVRLTVALNGDRLTKAQDEWVQGMRRLQPEVPIPEPEQRPFVAGAGDVVIPSYYLGRETEDGAEKPRVVSGHDFGSLRSWRAGETAGQYWFQDEVRTIVLHEKHLGRVADGAGTTVHEVGHAYEDALRDRAPGFYAGFRERWRAEYDGNDKFSTDYARTNPAEFFAEEFAVRFGPEREHKARRDPEAARLMSEAIEAAPQAVEWKIAGR